MQPSYEILSVSAYGHSPILPGVLRSDVPMPFTLYLNENNKHSPCEAYQYLYERSTADILIYIHDDVELYEDEWLRRVLGIFEDRPECGVVGLGGAVSLGHPDLYKRPYNMADLARSRYASNQRDWQSHGTRETGNRRVAVVDAFFMAIRRELLQAAGGWPTEALTHHCLDLWLCCEAARQEREVWMTGVDCLHKGGGHSIRAEYQQAKWLHGGSAELDHSLPHEWLYSHYQDVLPIDVRRYQ